MFKIGDKVVAKRRAPYKFTSFNNGYGVVVHSNDIRICITWFLKNGKEFHKARTFDVKTEHFTLMSWRSRYEHK